MAKVSVLNMEGSEVGTIELSDAVFGVEVNEHLVHMAVVNQLANNRQGTQSAKTRSEVSGGGRKPWRQKGTGHARQGSTRSPQWTGGGVVFAPKPRDYSFKMNKKEKRIALLSALSSKVAESKIVVLDEFKFENASEYSVKDEIKADIFAAGDKVDATAISKGKGFQGAIKRLGQSRGPMAHGSKFHRHQGSNGSATTPGRVFKGKGMPGHMGSKRITIQNLEVVRVDVENNVILVKGAVPGPKKSLVTLKETVKAAK